MIRSFADLAARMRRDDETAELIVRAIAAKALAPPAPDYGAVSDNLPLGPAA